MCFALSQPAWVVLDLGLRWCVKNVLSLVYEKVANICVRANTRQLNQCKLLSDWSLTNLAQRPDRTLVTRPDLALVRDR